MKQSSHQVKATFDGAADMYARFEHSCPAIVDAALMASLVTQAAARTSPAATRLLDIGCGVGFYTARMLELMPRLNVTLLDVSERMLAHAAARIPALTSGTVTPLVGDIRKVDLGTEAYDIVLAGAVLHHLRADREWVLVFRKIFRSLAAGGSFWVGDLVSHSTVPLQELMWSNYGQYLAGLKGPEYRDGTLAHIQKADSPRPLVFQIDLMREVGFESIEVLHKNITYAAFGGIKSRSRRTRERQRRKASRSNP